jgi:hypothetical protein
VIEHERDGGKVADESRGRGQLVVADQQVEHKACVADGRDSAPDVGAVEEGRVWLVLDRVADADELVASGRRQ